MLVYASSRKPVVVLVSEGAEHPFVVDGKSGGARARVAEDRVKLRAWRLPLLATPNI